MAVFNEAYVPGDIDDTGTFPIMNQNDPAIMYCHCLRPGIDFTSSISDQGGHIGTIINFTASLCGRFKPEVEQYIRFRVILNAQRDRAFSKLTRQFDWIFLSAIPRDEVVEFRFNEHRSFLRRSSIKWRLRKSMSNLISELFTVF